MTDRLNVAIGDKYQLIQSEGGKTRIDRHGEPWRNDVWDNVILTAAYELDETRKTRDALAYQIDEIVGCLAEYRAMPCDSLERRLMASIDRARLAKERTT